MSTFHRSQLELDRAVAPSAGVGCRYDENVTLSSSHSLPLHRLPQNLHLLSFACPGMASKLRVNVFANDPGLRSTGGKCLIVPAGTAWGAVLALAGAKLGFAADAAKRLFTANGAEVEDVDEIMPNDVLYVSQGEDFGQPRSSAPAAPPAPQFPWTCPVCTFLNEAQRPKCEICAADPPTSGDGGAAAGGAGPKSVSFIGSSAAPPAAAVVETPATPLEAAEPEPLPLFLRKVRAPVLPGEEEEEEGYGSDDGDEDDEEEWTDEEDDDLWYDYQEYEDYRLAMQLQAQIAKEHAAKKEEEENGLYECPICYDDKPLPQMYFIEACFHRFCMDCIKMHLEVTIKEGGLVKKDAVQVAKEGVITTTSNATDMGIRCPASGCANILTYNEIRHCATGILFEKFEEILLSRAIDGSKDMKWCPKPGCGNAIFRSARDDKLAVCSNGACGYTFCFECGEEYHEAFSECSTYAEYLKESQVHSAKSLSAAVAFHEWARTQDLRFCPSCHELIEKNKGCDHMYCTKCNTDFSWSEALMYADAKSRSSHWQNEDKAALRIVGKWRPRPVPKRRSKGRRKGARRAGLVKPQASLPGVPQTQQAISKATGSSSVRVSTKWEAWHCPDCGNPQWLNAAVPDTLMECEVCQRQFFSWESVRVTDKNILHNLTPPKENKRR